MSDREPYLSVIVAVRDGARWLDPCLTAIRASRCRDYELIVVDDGSSDSSAAIAARHRPDLLLRNDGRPGVFASRNLAAEHARGEVLFFTDADVSIRPDTLERVRLHFERGDVDGVIGVYSLEHPNRNLCSLYKNAWIRHTYLRSFPRSDWFFTGVGAVRRSLWQRCGRFDPAFSQRTGGGDIDFGERVTAAGGVIRGDATLEVVHRKRFGLCGLLLNDLRRSYGYTRLALARPGGVRTTRRRGIGNVRMDHALGALLAWLFVAAWVVSPLLPEVRAAGIALGLGYLGLALPFLGFLRTAMGTWRAIACLPLMFLDHLAGGLGSGVGVIRHELERWKSRSARGARAVVG